MPQLGERQESSASPSEEERFEGAKTAALVGGMVLVVGLGALFLADTTLWRVIAVLAALVGGLTLIWGRRAARSHVAE
jgi:hypothetical protein